MILVVGGSGGLSHRIHLSVPGVASCPHPLVVLDRECGRRHRVDHVPDVLVGSRAAVLQHHAEQVDPHVGGRGDLKIHIETHVASDILVLCAVALIGVGIADEALVGDEVDHRVVAESALAAAELHVEVVGGGRVAESLFNPVHARVEVRILPGLQGGDLLVGVSGREAVIGAGLVDGQSISVAVHELRLVEQGVELMVVGEFHGPGVPGSALGVDLDGAVDALVAIQGHGGSIFEDDHRLNLLGRDRGDVTLYAVDKHERRVVTVESLKSADIECRVLAGIYTGSLERYQTQSLTQHASADILRVAAGNVFRSYHGYRGRGLLQAQRLGSAGIHHPFLRGVLILRGERQAESRRQRKNKNIFLLHCVL